MSEPEEMVVVQLKHSISGRQSQSTKDLSVFCLFVCFLADRGNKSTVSEGYWCVSVYTKCITSMNAQVVDVFSRYALCYVQKIVAD